MKKLNRTAKELNNLLLGEDSIKKYLKLKKEISDDKGLQELRKKLDSMRKEICKNKEKDSTEYYELLSVYKSDQRIKEYEILNKEIKEVFNDISDILTLK